jgi:hypothetical protein
LPDFRGRQTPAFKIDLNANGIVAQFARQLFIAPHRSQAKPPPKASGPLRRIENGWTCEAFGLQCPLIRHLIDV